MLTGSEVISDNVRNFWPILECYGCGLLFPMSYELASLGHSAAQFEGAAPRKGQNVVFQKRSLWVGRNESINLLFSGPKFA